MTRGIAIIAGMRTGSNFLEEGLSQWSNLRPYGEVFNPHFVGSPGQDDLLGMSRGDRDRAPLELMARMLQAPGRPILRFFEGHDPKAFSALFSDPNWDILHLRRDPLNSYLSLQIARETNQWRLRRAAHRKSARVRFHPKDFARYRADQDRFAAAVACAAHGAGKQLTQIGFSKLGSLAQWTKIAKSLGLSLPEAVPNVHLVRQNPAAPWEKVKNPSDLPAVVPWPVVGWRGARSPLVILNSADAALGDWLTRLDGAPAHAVNAHSLEFLPKGVTCLAVQTPPLRRAQDLWGGTHRADFIARLRQAKKDARGGGDPAIYPQGTTFCGIEDLAPALERHVRTLGIVAPKLPQIGSVDPSLDTPRIRRLINDIWPDKENLRAA